MNLLYLLIAFLIFWKISVFISKKLGIEAEVTGKYKHLNKTHKWGEIIILAVSFILIDVIFFPEKAIFRMMPFLLVSVFRTFMEWKLDKSSKRYILSILYITFIIIGSLAVDLVFTNPIPVKLEANQVKEIIVSHHLASQESDGMIITDEKTLEPILSAISNADFEVARQQFTPRLEMTILLKDGHQVVIEEFKTRTMTRNFFPKEMLMHTRDLENIFNNFADKINNFGK